MSASEREQFLNEKYLNVPDNHWFMDVYLSRMSILKAVRDRLSNFEGTILDVGCGYQPYRSLLESRPSARYIGMDLGIVQYYKQPPDVLWDAKTIPLRDSSVGAALATEVLEHCPEPVPLLREIRRVLKPNGYLMITVPFMWPLHDIPYDEWRYTPFSLQRMFTEAGFTNVEIAALGGWDASLAQMIGLWIRRHPDIPDLQRRILGKLVMPVYRWLIRRDKPPADFEKSVMITGLCASARRA